MQRSLFVNNHEFIGRSASATKAARPRQKAFTLLELLVSTAVLVVIMVVVLQMTSHVGSLSRYVSDKSSSFIQARVAFERVTTRLGQATLNTYWALFDSDGNLVGQNPAEANPAKYGRFSELHFVSGKLPSVSGATVPPVHGIFFQAPASYSNNTDIQGLEGLLNTLGYFVAYRNSKDFLGDAWFKDASTVPDNWRFRLMEFTEPTENLTVYQTDPRDTAAQTWFANAMTAAKPVADNIAALFIIPQKFIPAQGASNPFGPTYEYNSRDATTPAMHHQLPPIVRVVMIAIDETSAQRLEAQHGSSMPPLFTGVSLASTAEFDADLARFKENLESKSIKYRAFESYVLLRNSKWSN